MKKRPGFLFGLCLSLVLVLFAASFDTPASTPVRAWAMPLTELPAHLEAGQFPPSPAAPPAQGAVDSTCAPATSTSPVFWDTPPRSGSVIMLPSGEEIIVPGPDDPVRVIILLDGDPVAVYKSRTRQAALGLTQAEQDRIRAYDLELQHSHRQLLQQVKAAGIALQVRREYTYILNGLAATIKMADMKRIAALPGVRGVYPDYEVHALLEDSVPLIGADQVWTMLDPSGQPVTGQGMRVAIIDTGIDYTHPDLGSGFGPGYKVVDGYDFVNDDADPMDDNGHGTHCAGIVAANGTVKGVAPDATLYGYKVLGTFANGLTSDIIAGIERATNPDGDPTTDDAVDVISLSLGGGGNPDSPLALAVDVAVDEGVVVAISAGNDGPEYQTVHSPGLARKAFTVGNSSKSDTIVRLSARGPVSNHYELIKPNIVAPGSFINSTDLYGGYRLRSGTSMAAPHIAGSAALIKQLHPSWSPQMIQANLMNTAKDLGEDIFTQGAGRVQVDHAASAQAVLTPGSIGLGLVDVEQPVWTKSETLWLTNVSAAPQQYSLEVSDSLPDGVTTHIDPANVTLEAWPKSGIWLVPVV